MCCHVHSSTLCQSRPPLEADAREHWKLNTPPSSATDKTLSPWYKVQYCPSVDPASSQLQGRLRMGRLPRRFLRRSGGTALLLGPERQGSLCTCRTSPPTCASTFKMLADDFRGHFPERWQSFFSMCYADRYNWPCRGVRFEDSMLRTLVSKRRFVGWLEALNSQKGCLALELFTRQTAFKEFGRAAWERVFDYWGRS